MEEGLFSPVLTEQLARNVAYNMQEKVEALFKKHMLQYNSGGIVSWVVGNSDKSTGFSRYYVPLCNVTLGPDVELDPNTPPQLDTYISGDVKDDTVVCYVGVGTYAWKVLKPNNIIWIKRFEKRLIEAFSKFEYSRPVKVSTSFRGYTEYSLSISIFVKLE